MSENDSNIITLKIKYSTDENSKTRILEYIKNYNNVLHFTYNRLHKNDKLKTKEITELQKSMNNIFVDSHFKNSAIFDSKTLLHNDKVIFGGKKLFIDRCQNKISKDDVFYCCCTFCIPVRISIFESGISKPQLSQPR